MANKMKAELIVSGGSDFEPGNLQAAIGLTPDRICRIGETIGRSIRKYDSNLWIVSTGYSDCRSLTICLAPLFARLEPFWERLRLAIPPTTQVQLSVAAHVHVHDSTPELNLEKDAVGRLATIGASIDIDVILVGDT